ncbi:hypothetical protein HOP50_05g36320 [Chloropicon primus]|uniref:Uncharacterized protein n=1 Tax=Chloropicon primus TaxID=1764295 RepID=A0A5B8MM50_9CHLO|nr:hypothetical protein A3770_05p36220 [Chloropicon primus]UPR00318.1 hypothetical protein HOP50_05g36320 [Chloropicon primus]|eukprot:QDZ21104.1 hypothetical protein A3770_05p36220 [Chloropicon primus]
MHSMRRAVAVAAIAVAGLCLVSVSAELDMSFNDMPKSDEIMTEIFGVLGGAINEQHDVTEDEVKRHLLRLRKRPSTVGSLLSGVAGSLAAVNYTQVYESFTDQYCSEPSFSRPSPPSIDVEDILYTTTSYTGPTLGVQISLGSCSDAGNKTFVCQRPQIVIVKTPATIQKNGPGVGASKPGGAVVDKSCSWSESKEIGHGESADLYNGGSETYDYSGYRAALYGRVAGRFAPISAAMSNMAGKARARQAARAANLQGVASNIQSRVQGVASNVQSRVQGAMANIPRFQMPRLGQMFKRRGLESEFDIHNVDEETHRRLEAVLPGFFK